MPEIISYKTVEPYLSDYVIGTDISNENVTRNYKLSEVVNTILAALNIGTVTSISTASSSFINVTGGPITTTGAVTMALSATGNPGNGNYLRGDGTWSEPGPTPTDIAVSSNGNVITSDVESLDYTGNGVSASGFNNQITVNIPGAGSTVDSLIAGAGISVNNAGITNVTITNQGVTQVRAGGNVTLSGGTGAVTVNTTKNAGTVTTVNAGLGLELTNGTTNPEIDVDFTTTNNYISNVPTTGVANLNDTIAFHDLITSSVKTSRFREIPTSILTQLKSYIDTNDENKVKNNEPVGYDEVAKATQMVSLTIAEYNQIVTKDPNTLYFIIGAGTSYTTTLSRNTAGITGTGSYSLNTTINGVTGTSITGPAGTNYTFVTTITGNNSTITNSNMPLTTTGTIQVNGNTETQNLSATVTQNVTPSVRAALVSITLGGNLGSSGAEGTIWNYAPYSYTTQDYDRPTTAYPIGPGYFPWNVDPKSGFAPDNGSGYVYSFNPRLLLLDTNTYKWSAGSEDPTDTQYLATGYDGSSWSQSWATGTVYSSVSGGQTNVTHAITGTWEFRTDYGSTLTVDTSRIILSGDASGTAPVDTYILSTLVSSTPTTSGSATITGARYNETATWTSQTISGTTNYVPGALTYQNFDTSAATLTNTVANPNSTKTVYAVCDIVYTAPAADQHRKLDVAAYLNSVITGTNYTLTNTLQTGNGTSGNLTYTVPTIVPNTGYILTNGTVTLAANPVTYNVTPFASGAGTQADPAIENNPTTPTGASPAVVSSALATVKITNATPNLALCGNYQLYNSSSQNMIFTYWICGSNAGQPQTLGPGLYQTVTSRATPVITNPTLGTVTLLGYSSSGPTITYQANFINSLGDSSGGLNATAPVTSSAQATLAAGDGNINTSITRISPPMGNTSSSTVYPGRTATINYYINGNIVQTQTSSTTVSGLAYNFTSVTAGDVVLIEVTEQ